jgi:hypothetical protein
MDASDKNCFQLTADTFTEEVTVRFANSNTGALGDAMDFERLISTPSSLANSR